MRANEVYRCALDLLLKAGQESSPRGISTIERLMTPYEEIDMFRPVVTLPSRKLNYRFMCSEARWILLGQSDVETITRHCNAIAKFSDDGRHMRGAYGPPFISQLPYVVDALNSDPHTRQAVMTLWRQSPRPSRDIPCTISLQFLIRHGHINTLVNMRSSDAWLGIPYDIFTFTMMTMFVALHLRERPQLGQLKVMAGSMHLYKHDIARAKQVRDDDRGTNLGVSIDHFDTPDDLLNSLWMTMECPEEVVQSPRCLMDEGICKLILDQA